MRVSARINTKITSRLHHLARWQEAVWLYAARVLYKARFYTAT
jgi:hypothetical protein